MASKTSLRVAETKSSVGLKGFLGLLSFSTILPLNIHTTIHEMAKFSWLWPIIGGFIGIMVGLLGYILLDLIHIPPFVAASIIYSFALWFTGFHHLDGLIDFGDGLMAHGDPLKKIEIMRDQRTGTGGLAYLIMVAIITFASIASAPAGLIFFILLISEIAAKIGLITCCTFSNSLTNGTGKSFVDAMNIKMLLLSLIIPLIIAYFTLGTLGIWGIVGGLAGGMIMALVARMKFTYTTGDVLGASNEISRMISLVFMVSIPFLI
ncbi:MAG: adenosylcobinamide-GDP ribazoletransferase [Methanobacterium sp.]|nr:adenosylcobinamide-GDP ribazoletransferase [Methanobacterium sp.]